MTNWNKFGTFIFFNYVITNYFINTNCLRKGLSYTVDVFSCVLVLQTFS